MGGDDNDEGHEDAGQGRAGVDDGGEGGEDADAEILQLINAPAVGRSRTKHNLVTN